MEKIIIHIHGDVHIHLGCDACEDFFDELDCTVDEPESEGFDESEDGCSDEEPAFVFCSFDDAPEMTLEEKTRKLKEIAAMGRLLMELEKGAHRKGAGHEGI